MEDATEGIGLYDFSSWDNYGGRPGEGNAIFAGRHSTQTGPGPLFQMESLNPGDQIVVEYGGETFTYQVVNVCDVPIDLTANVVARTERPSLTLITAASQDKRIIAFAEMEAETLPRDCRGGSPVER